jgi:hypothetical protein
MIFMGIDLRKSRRTYHIRAYWYKKDTDQAEILSRDAEPAGVFYARDLQDFQFNQGDFAGVMKFQSRTGSIETPDIVKMVENDFVYYSGELWIVNSVTIVDDNKMKQFSTKFSYITRIVLRK